MTLASEQEAAAREALLVAALLVRAALEATDTAAAKEAIRVARLNLVNAYDTLTQAEQDARAKYWKISA